LFIGFFRTFDAVHCSEQTTNKQALFVCFWSRKMRRGCRAAKESTDSMAAAWLRFAEITKTFNETLVIEKHQTKPTPNRFPNHIAWDKAWNGTKPPGPRRPASWLTFLSKVDF
jgi:hypothetical protein